MLRKISMAVAVLTLATFSAFAQTKTQGFVVFHGAAYCENISKIVGNGILPGSSVPCVPQIVVSAWTPDRTVHGFGAWVSYTDAAGNAHKDYVTFAAFPTVNLVAGTTFYAVPGEVTDVSVDIEPLAANGPSAHIQVGN